MFFNHPEELMILKIKIVMMTVCFSLMLPSTAISVEKDGPVAGTLSFMIGDVYVSSDGEQWREADFDMTIIHGEYVKTGEDAFCEIVLKDKTIVRMDDNSMQQFEKATDEALSHQKSIFFAAGKVWVNARKILSKGDTFKVRTNKAVCAIRGTTFSVDEDKEQTRVRVYKGQVATWSSLFDKKNQVPKGPPVFSEPVPVKGPHPVSMGKWVEVVSALQQITIDAQGGFDKKDFDPNRASDDPWVAWNMERDKLVSEK